MARFCVSIIYGLFILTVVYKMAWTNGYNKALNDAEVVFFGDVLVSDSEKDRELRALANRVAEACGGDARYVVAAPNFKNIAKPPI